MKIVFADAGYWIALASPSGNYHARAREVSAALGKFRTVTSELVLPEMLAALAATVTRGIASQVVQRVMTDPNTEVVPQTGLQFRAALTFYRERPDKNWSLVDCASFLIMQEKGIREALAHEHHFEQAGYVALLRP